MNCEVLAVIRKMEVTQSAKEVLRRRVGHERAAGCSARSRWASANGTKTTSPTEPATCANASGVARPSTTGSIRGSNAATVTLVSRKLATA